MLPVVSMTKGIGLLTSVKNWEKALANVIFVNIHL